MKEHWHNLNMAVKINFFLQKVKKWQNYTHVMMLGILDCVTSARGRITFRLVYNGNRLRKGKMTILGKWPLISRSSDQDLLVLFYTDSHITVTRW
jgi:hypothetical protein